MRPRLATPWRSGSPLPLLTLRLLLLRLSPPLRSEDDRRAVVAAIADPANAGRGALRVNGKMAELLHRDMAKRLLAKAAAIAAR